jgi:hypothetical protein
LQWQIFNMMLASSCAAVDKICVAKKAAGFAIDIIGKQSKSVICVYLG